MKQDVMCYNDFYKAFKDYDRIDNFSPGGLLALFHYLEDYDEEKDTESTLDVIALCCDYTEYENIAELQQSYNDIETIEDLNDHTIVIPIPGTEGFIIQNY